MREQTRRMEKRIQMTLPVQLESLKRPGAAERTVTENVSSLGARVVTKRPRKRKEWLLVTLFRGDHLRLPARVVYCQPLAGGRFGIGLKFQGATILWSDLPNNSSWCRPDGKMICPQCSL